MDYIYLVNWHESSTPDIYKTLDAAQIAVIQELICADDNNPEFFMEDVSNLFKNNEVLDFAKIIKIKVM